MADSKTNEKQPARLDQLQEQGIYIEDTVIDINHAAWDESLSKVWASEATGEIFVSIDRLLFESPLSMAIRFMEPQGFIANLENILACLDSMKFGVFARTSRSKSPEGKVQAKKLLPASYMRLPRKSARGPLLSRFYDEIAKYESELARLQQYEAQSKRVLQAAVKDESGKSALLQLQVDNQRLREEVEKLTRRVGQLSALVQSGSEMHQKQPLPSTLQLCQVVHVKEHENSVHLKSDKGQYSAPLHQCNGIPTQGARAIACHEGGVVRGVWVFEPMPNSFHYACAEVLVRDGQRMKVRGKDRIERVLSIDSQRDGLRFETGQNILLVLAHDTVIHWQPLERQSADAFVDRVFDEQTKLQISQFYGVATPADKHIQPTKRRASGSKSSRSRRAS